MALPLGGGDQRPPIRFTGSSGGHPFPVKRRNMIDLDVGGSSEEAWEDSAAPRLKRPRYVQYADHVAFKAADEHELQSIRQVHHPHPLPPPLHPYPLAHYPYPHPHPHMQHHRHHHHLRPSRSHRSSPEPGSCQMERTASGHGIRPDPTEGCALTELLEDDEAAQRVRDHMATFRRRSPDSKHERILRSIINPRTEYPLDNEALESIFSAANEIFFNGRLSQRVNWDWSHESSSKYDSNVIGTTALRRASNRGFETLIVLSSPILRDAKYSRRLLISTFLHELIHSYMFICCGFRARHCGGHTPGFQTIAELVDNWVGPEGGLYLKCMEADLERFRVIEAVEEEDDEEEDLQNDARYAGRGGRGEQRRTRYDDNVYFPCSGLSEPRDFYSDPNGNSSNRDQQHPPQSFGSGSNASFDGNATTWWTQRAIRPPLIQRPYTINDGDAITAHHTFYVGDKDTSTFQGY